MVRRTSHAGSITWNSHLPYIRMMFKNRGRYNRYAEFAKERVKKIALQPETWM